VTFLAADTAADQAKDAADRAVAQTLFEAGTQLLRDGKLNQACPKLSESMRIYPSVGALINLARCHEQQGKTATAWTEYSKAASMAHAQNDKKREQRALQRAKQLKPKLSRIIIKITTKPTGLKITRDGTELGVASYGIAIAADPGQHQIKASAPGFKSWSRTVVLGPDADLKTIQVPELEPAPQPAPKPTSTPTQPPQPAPQSPSDSGEQASSLSGMYYGAIVSGALGVVGLALGIVFGVKASSEWDEAQECGTKVCDPGASELSDDALISAAVSTGGFVVGGAAIATGALLWLLAPSDNAATEGEQDDAFLLPMVGPDLALVMIRGVF